VLVISPRLGGAGPVRAARTATNRKTCDPGHRRNAGALLNPQMKKKFSERRYGALKKGAARFWKRAAPMKATGGVTPVADFYQKSMVALFL
jgi:hypothetical protein